MFYDISGADFFAFFLSLFVVEVSESL